MEAILLAAAVLVAKGIRLVGIDRPGIGVSTPHRYQQVLDFADDLEVVADTLGIDKMAVIGLSGGGPYALSTAAAMPEVSADGSSAAVPADPA